MAGQPNLERRLQLLKIDEQTTNLIHGFYPTLNREIDTVIARFYAHLMTTPEGREIFANRRAIEALKPRQRTHWMSLFSCKFDRDYVDSATAVGRVHYERKVPPYVYMSSYNFFHRELNEIAWRASTNKAELRDLLDAIARLVTLDMELALSAYTRERWLRDDALEVVPAA